MEKIFEIEERFPETKDIKVNGLLIWPVYRIALRFLLLKSSSQASPAHSPIKRMLGRLYRQLRCLLEAANQLFSSKWSGRYDYVIFSNELERKKLGDKTIDKLATGLIEGLEGQRVLLVNYPGAMMKKETSQLSHPYVVDGGLIWRVAYFLMGASLKTSEADRQLIDKIVTTYNLPEDGMNDLAFFFKKVKVLSFLMKRWKPKAVFTCCYTYSAEIYVARQQGIQTVELQHGIISPLHPGYESRFKAGDTFTADSLLSFGENSIKDLSGNVVNLKNTRPVGNFYLEQVFEEPLDPEILAAVDGYESSVCVPTDYFTEEELVSFVVKLARRR
ncbi:MAG: hypothetical protein JST68_03600, partial [Bacteroidetes bacterium]|nr:hypothetical protein [Bacteroidota bacterium]